MVAGRMIRTMITALHSLVYANDPDAARAFFRDVLGFPSADTGGGWLIFKTGPSELGVHPSSWEYAGERGSTDQRFDLSLMCDDLSATMAELADRGATFAGELQDEPWGTTVQLVVPGAGTMTLYQPKYDPPATSSDLS
jgi:catechol 2,3-dioxygenase-like lactoylglutathione lyase family enzyme